MMGAIRNETAKHLCERLVRETPEYKLRAETFYDNFFYVLDEVKKWEQILIS